jgi:hypothetical protein
VAGYQTRPDGARHTAHFQTPWRVLAVDGKTVRGARGCDGRAVHLMAALDQARGVVLAQVDVDGKTNEIPMFSALLDQVATFTDVVVTADALCRRRYKASYEDVRVMPRRCPGTRLATPDFGQSG